MNLLIPYVHRLDHQDPILEEFTYGNIGVRGRKLERDVRKGDYVFFHTGTRGKKYLTAYYVVDRVLRSAEVAKDGNIVAKYRNPHIREFLSGDRTDEAEDVMIFGDPIASRVLERPLVFGRTLAEQLSLGVRFGEGRTDTQCIGSATRAWRELTAKDVEVLKGAIKESQEGGVPPKRFLSSEEVAEVIEKDIERLIKENPRIIGESLQFSTSQLDTEVGRIDLLLKDERDNPVLVELKVGKIGRDAVSQLRRYMRWTREQTDKEVAGVIVCAGVMPAFEEDFKTLGDIRIFCYGWQLGVYPWGE